MKNLSLLVLLLLLLSSCRSQELIQAGDTIEVAYEKAYSLYEDGDWDRAANAFEIVIGIGRGTDFGQDAQFYLAESYFNQRQFLVAATEYERYSSTHPNSSRREYVDYQAAMCYYHMSPRHNIDQGNTHSAIQRFRLFNARYPNSDRVNEVGEHLVELRNKLARKNYDAAEFYMRTRRYGAAAVYFTIVVDRYPESDWTERALVQQIEAYYRFAENSVPARQEERYLQALQSYETYLQIFPRGEYRERAEEWYDRVSSALLEYDNDGEAITSAAGS